MNKKRIERLAVFALAAFLVGYFVYQVAYGMTMGPNGTMTVTQGNVSATLTAPPGTNVSSFKIMPEEHRNSVDPLGDSSWTIHNSTSGSTGTINFHVRIIECGIKVSKDFCYAKVIEIHNDTSMFGLA